jgi:hypothetical protein
MRSKWVLPLFACLGLSLTISGQGVQAVQVKSITLPVVFGSMSPVGIGAEVRLSKSKIRARQRRSFGHLIGMVRKSANSR